MFHQTLNKCFKPFQEFIKQWFSVHLTQLKYINKIELQYINIIGGTCRNKFNKKER